jgi:hypothetical protein
MEHHMTYSDVKKAWYNESFDLVLATQAQISKLEAEMEKNGDWHGVDWLQSRYDDFKEEMMEITNACITGFQS